MASSTFGRWVRPEVYPLLVPIFGAVGMCGMQLWRNIRTNPEVRVSKEKRAAGVLDNFAEGERYKEHFVRKYVRNQSTRSCHPLTNSSQARNKAKPENGLISWFSSLGVVLNCD